ncbi:hypothetical protein JG687_00018549, partial [Phytophthora cactorum]
PLQLPSAPGWRAALPYWLPSSTLRAVEHSNPLAHWTSKTRKLFVTQQRRSQSSWCATTRTCSVETL